jgi:hypothetical protein
VQRAVEERDLLPDRWREVSTLADWEVRLTPARARTLLASMATLVDEAEDEPVNTDDSAAVVVQVAMFPRPGTVAIDGDADGVVDQTIDSRDG